jgi:predicted aldo/keto reductase-like oxidoreductase
MIYRKLGRIDFQSSVVMFGAAKLGHVDQSEADAAMQYALEHRVNHFDTAASYGQSEVLMGPSMANILDRIFLATKTGERDRAAAKAEILRSLEKLQVTQIDLIQLHAVGDLHELDLCTRRGGALEALLEAKEEGLVKHIGITGHGHSAPHTHLEALQRYPFDTMLLPLNYHFYQMPDYREAFDRLMAEATQQQVAVRAIKAIAKGPWGAEQQRDYATWYEPFTEQKMIDACVHFVLSFPGLCGFASAGDIRLFPQIIDAVERYGSMSEEEAHAILGRIPEYASPF